MPPKPLPKKTRTALKKRFRDIVVWAFDGNLTLASRALGLPFSTVQKYYQFGPRRISAAALSSIDRVTGLGDWLTGEAVSEITGKFPTSIGEAQGWDLIQADAEGPYFPIPKCVLWRVDSVADAMMQINPRLDRDNARLIVVGSILDALKNGLIQAPGGNIRLPATVGGRLRPDIKDPAGSLGWGKDAARHVHGVCAWWEGFLGIE